jgi:hypothetical protein
MSCQGITNLQMLQVDSSYVILSLKFLFSSQA